MRISIKSELNEGGGVQYSPTRIIPIIRIILCSTSLLSMQLIAVNTARAQANSVEENNIAPPRQVEFSFENGEIYYPGSIRDGGAHPSNLGFIVADYQNRQVVYLDVLNNRARIVGRSGQGPGEYLLPSAARFDMSGNLFVYDDGNNRIQVSDSALSPISIHRPPFLRFVSLDVLHDEVLVLTPAALYKPSPFYLYSLRTNSMIDSANAPIQKNFPRTSDLVHVAENQCIARVVSDSLIAVAYITRRRVEIYDLRGEFVSALNLEFYDEDEYREQRVRREDGVIKVPNYVRDAEAHPTESRMIFFVPDRNEMSSYIFYSVDLPDGKDIKRYSSPYDAEGTQVLNEMYGTTGKVRRNLQDFSINKDGQILGIEAFTMRILFWSDGIGNAINRERDY